MIDIKLLREDFDKTTKLLKTKDSELFLEPLRALDSSIRELKVKVENLKNERNLLSKQIGEKKRAGDNTDDLMKKVGSFGNQIKECDELLMQKEEEIHNLLAVIPNIPMEGIKSSMDPQDNECLKEVGEKPHFDFEFKNHLELNERHHFFDFEKGAKITGSGWPTYKGMGARLEWALINFMLDHHIKKGFTQWMVPLLVRSEMMYGSGQFPKFLDQSYKVQDDQFDLNLIPTAEVALSGLHYDEILNANELPKKYVAYTPCFRREAGGAGKQERGLIRTHQFNKVEMFAFTTPEDSEKVFNQFVESAEQILDLLELPYKRMLLVTGDMSFSAAKTIDIEAYLPGQDKYVEVSSVSNCTDFQARRSKIRYKEPNQKAKLVHTLNGSGLATSRLMVALLENHQQSDGSIKIPEVLQKYLDGKEKLLPIA